MRNKNIIGLDISMNDGPFMEIVDRSSDLK